MEHQVSNKQISNYYDSFKAHQLKLGVNVRHRTIYRNLLKAGLNKDSNVLEIGCGIGTVSSLILRTVNVGRFVGVDISPASIDVARMLSARHKNAEFIVSDMNGFAHQVMFDFIVFPDVLEHIPAEQHGALFATISKCAKPGCTVLINIPSPDFQIWLKKHHPEKMQIVDQAINFRDLLDAAYPAGFELESAIPYPLHYKPDDYYSITFRYKKTVEDAQLRSWWKRGIENLLSKLR